MTVLAGLPRAADYLEALQFPAECFADPELAHGAPELTPIGLPRATSGNVAVVFKVTAESGRVYAVRCFVRAFDDLDRRYRALVPRLRSAGPWAVGTEYQPRGIHVGDDWYPVVKMAWCEATPLVPWIEAHLWDTAAMSYAALRFAALADGLRAAAVAHGDLQHGNILVAPGGDLRLVDYDGMWVPELDGLQSNERGHRNYAHPRRTREHFGPALDAFPSWVVYASLAALSVDPLLWGRLDGGDECLLFRAADFADPGHSDAFACLERSDDTRLRALAAALRSQLARTVDDVVPLSPAVAPPPALTLPTTATAASMDELRERQRLLHVLRTASAAPAAPRAQPEPSAWTGPRPSAEVDAAFGIDVARHRHSLAVVLGVLALLPFLGVLGVLPVALALLASLAGVGAAAWVVGRQYRELPAVRAAQPQQQVVAARRDAVARAQARVDDLGRQRAAVDAEEAAVGERERAAETALRHREHVELQAVDDELRRVLSDLDAREHELYRAEHHERADALRALHAQVLDEQLVEHRLASARMSGITDKLVYALALDDVRTAADIADVRTGDEVVLVRRDGREVRGGALGPEQAAALLRWRRTVERKYEHLLPGRLPPEREAAVAEAYTAKRAALTEEGARARADAARRSDGVRAASQAERDQRAAAVVQATQEAAQRRLRLDQELARARKDLAEAQFHASAAEREAGTAGRLTLAAYFRLLVGR